MDREILIEKLNENEVRIIGENDPSEKVSLLFEHINLYREYNLELVATYNRLLTEAGNRYEESLKLCEVFKKETEIYSGLYKNGQFKYCNSLSDLCTKLIENPRCIIDEAFRALECEMKKNNPDVQLTVRLNFITRLVIALKLVFSKKN
jgi:hypothetical protein